MMDVVWASEKSWEESGREICSYTKRHGHATASPFFLPYSWLSWKFSRKESGRSPEGALELLIIAVHGVDPRGHSEWTQRRRGPRGTCSSPLSPTLRAQPWNLFLLTPILHNHQRRTRTPSSIPLSGSNCRGKIRATKMVHGRRTEILKQLPVKQDKAPWQEARISRQSRATLHKQNKGQRRRQDQQWLQ